MSWMLSTQWLGMADNMDMCNGCSRVKPSGQVPATELKGACRGLFSSQTQHQACVYLGQVLEQPPFCPHLLQGVL